MPIQNRVDPFGQLHCWPARGLFTGNRGVIHDPDTKLLTGRRWTTKSWIVCALQHKGRRRDVWGLNSRSGGPGWTELFFLDEPTALAAGHRPCFECRRAAAKAYVAALTETFGRSDLRVQDIDNRLHAERLAAHGRRGLVAGHDIKALPDGAVIAAGGKAFAVSGGMFLPWSFDGYGRAVPLEQIGDEAALVTPPVSVAALRAGYRPVWHASAEPPPP